MIHPNSAEPPLEQRHTVVTTRCLHGDWTGPTLDDARRHTLRTSHAGFRTTTEVVSAAGRLIGEMVEVHQL